VNRRPHSIQTSTCNRVIGHYEVLSFRTANASRTGLVASQNAVNEMVRRLDQP